MKVTRITVHAARTMSVPAVPYSAIRPGVDITADIEEGEDFQAKVKELHFAAESLLEDQCDELAAYVAHRVANRNKKHRAAADQANKEKQAAEQQASRERKAAAAKETAGV